MVERCETSDRWRKHSSVGRVHKEEERRKEEKKRQTRIEMCEWALVSHAHNTHGVLKQPVAYCEQANENEFNIKYAHMK